MEKGTFLFKKQIKLLTRDTTSQFGTDRNTELIVIDISVGMLSKSLCTQVDLP